MIVTLLLEGKLATVVDWQRVLQKFLIVVRIYKKECFGQRPFRFDLN